MKKKNIDKITEIARVQDGNDEIRCIQFMI